jgi:cytochrome c556
MVEAAGTVAEACSACHDVYREKQGPKDRCLP